MAAGGKKKITPMKKAPPKTALERTSPKSAAALEDLEARQKNSAALRQMSDYEADRYKVLSTGGTGREAALYARKQAERNKKAGFGYGAPEHADFRDREAGIGFKKGGKVRGDGICKKGRTKGRMV